MTKITKALWFLIAIIFAASIGYMAGSKMEIYRQIRKKGHPKQVETIAIVNMDDGVMREEEQVNYASQLMLIPDADFVSAGLNDAKQGIQNGSYAAYIIIPESFSASVASIENNPQKITLEYAYNPNLSEEAKVQAVQKVHYFRETLNANISYMYIDAVLSAFHDVQDDSAEILANDIKELKRLQNVDAAKLVASVEQPEVLMPKADIQQIELADYMQQNRSFLTEMSEGYGATIQKSKADYLEIQSANHEVSEETENFFALYQMIVTESAEAQAQILKEGQKNLEKGIGLYNENIAANTGIIEQQLSAMAYEQLAADQCSVQKQLDEILQDIDDANQQSQWEDAYQNIQGYVQKTINEQAEILTEDYCEFLTDRLKTLTRNAYLQGSRDALDAVKAPDFDKDYQKHIEKVSKEDFVTVSGNDIFLTVSGNCLVYDAADNDGLLPDYGKSSIAVDWDNPTDEDGKLIKIPDTNSAGTRNYEITLTIGNGCGEAAAAEAANKVVGLLSLEENGNKISDILKKEITEPVLAENLAQMGNLSDSQEALNEKTISYENRLFEFDPNAYLEQADLSNYLNEIAGNTENMMNAVSANNAEYAAYAANADRAASHNMASLRTALNEAQSQTASNVENSIEGLIESRETINAQNVRLLEGFTRLLTYTRVKSQGNPEVYDYIVNPIMMEGYNAIASVGAKAINAKSASLEGETLTEQSFKKIGESILCMAIAICIVVIIIGICRKYFYRGKGNMAEESEEIF